MHDIFRISLDDSNPGHAAVFNKAATQPSTVAIGRQFIQPLRPSWCAECASLTAAQRPRTQRVHSIATLSRKRCSSVPVKRRWRWTAGKVTAGLASHWP